MSKILKAGLDRFSMDSIYVKMAVARLFQQRKMKNVKFGDFKEFKNVINEGDLLLAIFDIEDEAKKKGIDLRPRKKIKKED